MNCYPSKVCECVRENYTVAYVFRDGNVSVVLAKSRGHSFYIQLKDKQWRQISLIPSESAV